MKLAAIDFETFWDSKFYTLKKMGAVEYIRDPRFHPLMLGVCTSDGVQVWETEEEMKAALEGLAAGGYAVVGHNMNGFDALIVSEYFEVDLPFVLDTQVMMRWMGLSRTMKRESHELLTSRLGHGVKQAGTVVSDGKATKEEFTPEDWAFFKQYCADDTSQCYRNAMSLLPFVSGDALRFSNLTARMATQPKFCLDADKIKQYIEDLDRKVAAARDELQDIFGFPTPEDMLKAIRSATTLADMLRTLGAEVPMKLSEKQTATQLKKLEAMGVINPPAERYYVYTPALAKSDTEFIDMLHHPDERVRLLVRTRLEYNSSIERSRAETLLKFALQHKPYPVQLGAFVAHTSRYTAKTSAESTSDKTNLQNLSKRNPEKLALRRAIHAPAGHKIVAVDSSQIEARLLAWAACQDDLVMQFREGRDPYAELAEKFGSGMTAKEIHDGAKSGNKKAKEQRNLAKTFILSAGYGTSKSRAAAVLWTNGMRLHTDRVQHDLTVAGYHGIYREAVPNIVNFWRTCDQVLRWFLETPRDSGVVLPFGGPNGDMFKAAWRKVLPDDEEYHASIELPSGYKLWYPELQYDPDIAPRGEYYYVQYRGGKDSRKRIYGAALTENLIQSLAFQLLMWQACRIDELGIPLSVNLHDCWAAIVPEDKAEATQAAISCVMSAVPPWLSGFPVACEGEVGDTFEVV